MSASQSGASLSLYRNMASKTPQVDENVNKAGKEDIPIAHVSDSLKSLLVFSDNDSSLLSKRQPMALSPSSMVNQSCPEETQLSHESPAPSDPIDPNAINSYLARFSRQPSAHAGNISSFSINNARPNAKPEHGASCNSVPMTPAPEGFGTTATATRPASATVHESSTSTSDEEVMRLKYELAQAQNRLSHLELSQSRPTQSGPDQSVNPSPVDMEFPKIEFPNTQLSVQTATRYPPMHSLNTAAQHPATRDGTAAWPGYDDSRSDTSDAALSATGFNRFRNIWGGARQGPGAFVSNSLPPPELPHNGPWAGVAGRHSSQGYQDSPMPFDPSLTGNFRPDRLTPDFDLTARPARRNGRYDVRFGVPGFGNMNTTQGYGGQAGYGGYNYPQQQFDSGPGLPSTSHNGMGSGTYSSYQPQPVGTPLSPLASEFTSAMTSHAGSTTEGQTYLPTTEPLNYRRLLDRNVNCNWKYIVDKIVCSNDQQASIFLQQKLKVGTPDQKYEIVEAIVAQAYPLMINRFGNFLVQRCFEHGTPEQVIKIAEAIRGCTLNLSMDPFGCHVVQKAFDSVPEDYKAIMVHELLRRIPETVIHRYACHVWQKLFELRWSESPPQIMKYVNDALCGMWHEVALGETGSLVVQNIFENCLEEDKRPCIEEVLSNIDIVAHGQFGNWCIQHICEHGAPADRSRAIDHVIRYAAEYSMDQYASKVVEKCLKIGGPEFLARYLDRVCEGRMDRPRIPLIDIASDQYGNYLIQWILTHANPQHRDVVAAHIRKHIVSLRGSKFGSRVGMLCTNPAIATRPGPGVSTTMARMPAGPRYGGRGYQ
ncbi:armadillo-type protein [Xylariaceae sp. FL1019]|nr:armadillo-type protein [Xylariaceae sp. FL1019]